MQEALQVSASNFPERDQSANREDSLWKGKHLEEVERRSLYPTVRKENVEEDHNVAQNGATLFFVLPARVTWVTGLWLFG